MLTPERRPERGDAGLTLVEMSVVMLVVGILAASTTTMLLAIQRVVSRTLAVAEASTQLRAALNDVGHTITAASTANPPTRVGADWYVEALMPPSATSPVSTCVQWRVVSGTGRLQERSWPTVNPVPTRWRTVATGLVNDPQTQQPFLVVPADDGFAFTRVGVRLLISAPDVGTITQRADYTLRNSGPPDGGPTCTQVGRP